MTTLGIILIVVAFGIGALITYLIMRAKQSVIREQSRLTANSISELQQRIEDLKKYQHPVILFPELRIHQLSHQSSSFLILRLLLRSQMPPSPYSKEADIDDLLPWTDNMQHLFGAGE